MQASVKPSSIEPASPMKMLAGWKLKRRKANVAPASTAAMMPIAGKPVDSEMTQKVSAEMPQTPAARPSRPSMKFTMLTIVAIQKAVTSTDDRQREVRSSCR